MANKKAAKQYFWLKLKDSFFDQLEIKKLRKMAGGDTYTIIYLKLQLLSIKNNGYIVFDHIENDFVDELALQLNEEADNIRATLVFLQKLGLIEETDIDNFFLPAAAENIGKESESAERVRKHREDKKKMEYLKGENQLSLQCNATVTTSNAAVTVMKQNGNKTLQIPINEGFSQNALQCNTDVTSCNAVVTQVKQDCNKPLECPENADFLGALHCNKNVTLEIEKEIELEKEIDKTDDDDHEEECARATPVDKIVDKSVDNFGGSVDSFALKILMALGKQRKPTQFELALLEKWLLDWGLSEQLVRYILPRTINAENPSFRYLDAILGDLYQHQIFTVEQARAYHQQRDTDKRLNSALRWGGDET